MSHCLRFFFLNHELNGLEEHKLSSKSGDQKKPWAEMAPAWIRLEVSKGSLFSRRLQPKLDAMGCDSYTPPKRTTAARSLLLTLPPPEGHCDCTGLPGTHDHLPSQGLLLTSAKPLSYLWESRLREGKLIAWVGVAGEESIVCPGLFDYGEAPKSAGWTARPKPQQRWCCRAWGLFGRCHFLLERPSTDLLRPIHRQYINCFIQSLLI